MTEHRQRDERREKQRDILWRIRAGALLATAPAGVILGVLAVSTVIAAESTRHETYGKLLGASVIAMVIFWLARSYALHLEWRLRERVSWSFHEIVTSLARGAAILVGATVPIAALFFDWVAGASLQTGVTVALWSAGIALVAFELLASIRRHLGRRDLAVETSIGVVMGLGILVMRLLLH